MTSVFSRGKWYFLTAILGAIGGGIIVAVATRAIPKMMSQMMAGMMQNMMAQEGCNPMEMCQQMMKQFAEAQQNETETEEGN